MVTQIRVCIYIYIPNIYIRIYIYIYIYIWIFARQGNIQANVKTANDNISNEYCIFMWRFDNRPCIVLLLVTFPRNGDECLKRAEASLDMFRDSAEVRGQASAQHTKAMLYFAAGEKAEGVRQAQECSSLLKDSGARSTHTDKDGTVCIRVSA